MKLISPILLAFILTIPGCDKLPDSHGPLAELEGLSLYWDHEVFDTQGRVYRFEFYGTKKFENSYDLVFNYTINQRDILITLVDEIDNGECPKYPSPFGIDALCTPRGRIIIPESLISNGSYKVTIKTPNFEINSELIVWKDSTTLTIAPNEPLSCEIHAVYPIPLNLLFGGVVYSGTQNADDAEMFINDLLSLGITKTNVPDYPYRYLSVNKDGNAGDSYWPPDNYSIGLLYAFDKNFKDVFNLAENHFNKSNINIYLYSSNGDQALLNKIDGVRVVYAVN